MSLWDWGAFDLDTLSDNSGWDLSGMEKAGQFIQEQPRTQLATALASGVAHATDAFHSGADASEASEMLGNFGDYLGELFETSETAARNQAIRNEEAAYNAWQRSEKAADAALQRARSLRSTAYQDAVSSLKAAGLNPVLAAGGGISGSAVTAPQANAPAASSGMADGLNAADLLLAIASLLSGAGSLIGSINPKRIISQSTNTSEVYSVKGK